MFKLKESDYKALYPMAKRLFGDKYNTPYLSETFRTNIGKRALVEMLFLEKYGFLTAVAKLIVVTQDSIESAKKGGPNINPNTDTKTNHTNPNINPNTDTKTNHTNPNINPNTNPKTNPTNNINVTTTSSESKGFFIGLFNRVKNIHGIMMDPNRKNIVGLLGKVYRYAFKHPIPFFILAGVTAIILAFLVSPKLRKKALTFARNIFSATPDEAKAALGSAVGNVT